MCGRFVLSSTAAEIADYFGAVRDDELLLPASYNVAPTDDVYGVVGTPDAAERRLAAFHWGLVPWWAKDPKVGSRMINARAESLADKPAFRKTLERQRCLVPADGFYEWQAREGGRAKQPYFIHRPDGEPYAFAGLWDEWKAPDGSRLRSCTIITCAANPAMAPLHDRMPVVLPPAVWDGWLDTANGDVPGLRRLLVPAPDALFALRPVGTDVNSVRNNAPHLTDPVDLVPEPDPPAVLPGGRARAPSLFDAD